MLQIIFVFVVETMKKVVFAIKQKTSAVMSIATT